MCKKTKNFTIFKGWHYAINFFPSFKLIDDEMTFERKLVFDQNCAYEIDEPSCVNKLFGFCFGFGVHQDSIRFGWTYNTDDKCIHIWHYVYQEGKLTKKDIFKIVLSDLQQTVMFDYQITLKRLPSDNPNYRHKYEYQLLVDYLPLSSGCLYSNKLFITTLGPYFGGNTRAPHKMIIKELKK